jgi:hypothetical protein
VRGHSRDDEYDVFKHEPAGLALTVPTNIWTLEEFAALVAANVEDVLSQRHASGPPVTDEEISELTRAMVGEISSGVAPAGNA